MRDVCYIYECVHTYSSCLESHVSVSLVFQVPPPSLSGLKGQVCSCPCVGIKQSSPGGEW